MRIAVTGATGLVGSALVPALAAAGHTVHALRRERGTVRDSDVYWNPANGEIDADALEGVDALVNLAGAPVDERWTDAHKREIRDSRVKGTALLARTAARLRTRPRVFVAGSAIGYYGPRGDEIVDESSPRGSGYLATVAGEWEGAAAPARDAGVRVVHPRLGIVLSLRGGVLKRLLPIFTMGAGGRIGSGRQWVSWIALDDVVRAFMLLLTDESLAGPVNVVTSNPVTNGELAHALGHVLHRPAIAHAPAFAIKLMFGEMGEETVLSGQRVMPRRLQHAGFEFLHPTLEEALRAVIG